MQVELTEAELEVLIVALARCADDGLTYIELAQKLKTYRTSSSIQPAEE